MVTLNVNNKVELKSILDNAEGIISNFLCGQQTLPGAYRQKKYRENFVNSDRNIDGQKFLMALKENVERNLKNGFTQSESKENWRTRSISTIDSKKNKSKEVVLERHLAKIFERDNLVNWWNQMPVASGLVGKTSDRRRAIDLVCRENNGETFHFIELKIASDSPLYALIEVVQYGLIYLVLRDSPFYLSAVSRSSLVFQAKRINLVVLAPEAYFTKSNFARFEQQLNIGFSSLLRDRKDGLQISVKSYFHPRLDQWAEGRLDDVKGIEALLDINSWKTAFDAG